MARILVTGRNGQVVRALVERVEGRADFDIVAVGRPDLDLNSPESVEAVIGHVAPALVVNAAAYTAVDRAEDEPNLAMAVNGKGARAVAAAAAIRGVPVVHISTDYVYDGTSAAPYCEEDPVNPLGVYGQSKLLGELGVAHANPRHVILRTAWVYSSYGNNFVKTMLKLAEKRDVLNVVADQIGNPTSAELIADGILAIATQLAARPFSGWGVYHLAGAGEATWADFAVAVFKLSEARGGPVAKITPIQTSEYPTRARRPANSRLNTAKFQSRFDFVARPWQDDLSRVLDTLLSNNTDRGDVGE